jgi:putative SOS response-associated peptidase YedK
VNEHYAIAVDDNETKPSYNCAPTQLLPVISNDAPGKLSHYRWGLIPFWAKDQSIGNKMINARAETITEKPSFKNAFQRRRCIIPADAFYEWRKEDSTKKKIPYRIFLRNQPLFSMAGIWGQWKNPEGETIRSFSIITTSPNKLMTEIHDRMPVILPKELEKPWLESKDEHQLLEMLKPFPAELMNAYRVSELVNSPGNNSVEITKPLGV